MSAGPGEKGFPLLLLPSELLLHFLRLLPHTALLPLAGSCSFLHSTVHSSASLWRALALRPAMAAGPATTQSLLAMLRGHGRHVEAVRMGYSENMANTQQVLAFVAATCPNLRHLAISCLYAEENTNPLRLIAASFPQLVSLKIKHCESDKGIDQLGQFAKLTHLYIKITNDTRSQDHLTVAFRQLHSLRRVTVEAVGFYPEDLPSEAGFIRALVESNLSLEEVVTDTWEGGVRVSTKDKNLLKMKGIKFMEKEEFLDSSFEESGDESDEEDEHNDDSGEEDGGEDQSDYSDEDETSNQEDDESDEEQEEVDESFTY
jgi:hypothetical protein